jgi:hypothetical protein
MTSASACPSQEFREREINGAPCQIGQVDIVSFNHSKGFMALSALATDLPGYMHATNTATIINAGGTTTMMEKMMRLR